MNPTHKLSQEVVDILTARLADEMTAFYTYRAFVNWADDMGYKLVSAFYEAESADELVHAKKLETFATDWGVRLVLPVIETPQINFGSYLEILDLNYELEYDLYEAYRKDSSTLLDLGETAVYDFLGFHRAVQLESVADVKTKIDRVKDVEPTAFNLRQMEEIVFE